jgi:uncharacterized protein DUF4337
MSGTEHHLEEAEHAKHAAHNPFDKRVALSMAIVAAGLACTTLLSHRAHNEVLQDQILAADKITEASDQWAYFQAKKNRQYMYEADAALIADVAKDPSASSKGADQIKEWKEEAAKYKDETKGIEDKAKELETAAKEFREKAEAAHVSGNFFDLGELGIELALVLCSVAMLAKNKVFWIVGIAIGAVGFFVALCGFASAPIMHVLTHIGLFKT